MKIDAVITWVDGNDPAHIAKRNRYGTSAQFKNREVAGSTRYADIGEIFWCVASLNRFAPWLNKIYIVMDAQDPCLEPFLCANFPDGHIPYEIVDHKVIFKGYEEYLPTFNSISIETMTWRIPGLSEHYIEFNDDLMLTAPVRPEDFFTEDGKLICYAQWSSIPLTLLTRLLKPYKYGIRPVTTKGLHLNAARLSGRFWLYLRLTHCQKALVRSFFENFYISHPDALLRNISYRFRDAEQFSSQALMYVSLAKAGKCIIRSASGNFFYFMPKGDQRYFDLKMEKLRCFKGPFACFNSIDQATNKQQSELISWIEDRLQVNFSNK